MGTKISIRSFSRLPLARAVLAGAALSVAITGCGKDKTLEDWRREKVEKEIAKIQNIAGIYRGTVVSQGDADARALGTLELQLEADTMIGVVPDGIRTDQRPVLRGKATLTAGRPAAAVFRDGYYDSTNGAFKVSIPVKLQDGTTAEISIAGVVADGKATGAIEAYGYPEAGGRFTLTREGDGTSSGALPASPPTIAPGVGSGVGLYSGQARFYDGAVRQIDLTLLRNRSRADEEFLDLLRPIKIVQANLGIGEWLRLNFQQAEWNQQTGTLIGKGTAVRKGQVMELALTCQESRGGGDGTDGQWLCRYVSGVDGVLAELTLSPRDPAAPRPPAPANPNDSFAFSYKGKATLGSGKTIPASLTMARETSQTADEYIELFLPRKTVQIGLDLDGVPFTFIDAEWNQTTGNLIGRTTKQNGTDLFFFSLSCQVQGAPPPMGQAPRAWKCRYFSSQGPTAEVVVERAMP